MTKLTPELEQEIRSDMLPCPFCGEIPSLPDGDGTQYEIVCECGMALSCVQICDLMTYDERESATFTHYRYADEYVERAKREAIRRWNIRTKQ